MPHKLTDILFRKEIAKFTVAILLTMVILIVSTFIAIAMIRTRMENYVKDQAEQKTLLVNNVTNNVLIANEWVINSFMSGMADLTYYRDSVTGEIKIRYLFPEKTLNTLTVNDVYDRLKSFINYHVDYQSVVMVFEPGVLKDYPEGIATEMRPIDTVRYNLLDEYDIFGSKFYKRVEETGQMYASAGYVTHDSLFVFTIGSPFYDAQGKFIGEFWIDTDAEFFSDLLIKNKSDNDLVASFINADGRIIASTNRENNSKFLKDVSMKVCGGVFPKKWYSEVMEGVKLDESSHFRYYINGEAVVTYILPLRNPEYKLMIVKPEAVLYSKVESQIWLPMVVMIASIILITICLVYIFLTFKRKNDESNRMEAELNVAAEIQQSILPANLQGNDMYEVYGFQRSAKTVGGDLYDFKQVGNLLHFCIGDVSGKGMPAALVMSELCSLYRYIISHESDPREIMSLINKALMERSDDSMFCTLFVGVLNLDTGELRYCNAGHNPPLFINNNGVSFLKIKPNMPVCAFSDFSYEGEVLQLTVGDRLFLYTDGVTEAKSETNGFFGEYATLSVVTRVKGLGFRELVKEVLSDLKHFTKKAEQNDDITMLCVEYRGMWSHRKMHFDGVKERVSEVVDAVLNACGLIEDMKLRLAVEEPVQNISDYAYEEDGPLDVEILRNGEECVEIILKDFGRPFNPLKQAAPDLTLSVEDRKIGGLGIFLTKQIMKDVAYAYEDGQNILKLKYSSPVK